MVVGYGTNPLYLWCTSLSMPMGKSRVYHYNVDSEKMELSFDAGSGVSEKQNAWLTDLCSVNFPAMCYAIKKW